MNAYEILGEAMIDDSNRPGARALLADGRRMRSPNHLIELLQPHIR